MDVEDIHFDMMFPNFEHDYIYGEIDGMDLEFDPTQWPWSNLKTLYDTSCGESCEEIIQDYTFKNDLANGVYDIEQDMELDINM